MSKRNLFFAIKDCLSVSFAQYINFCSNHVSQFHCTCTSKFIFCLTETTTIYTPSLQCHRRMIPLRNDAEKLGQNIKRHVQEYNRHLQEFQQVRGGRMALYSDVIIVWVLFCSVGGRPCTVDQHNKPKSSGSSVLTAISV